MSHLALQRIRFSIEADQRLRTLKGRTGITPNLLCRIAFCVSIEEVGAPLSDASEMSEREINRYTLLGEFDQLFVGLLCGRHPEVLDDASGELTRLFVAHVHRGLALMANRVKGVPSLLELVSAVAPHPAHIPRSSTSDQ